MKRIFTASVQLAALVIILSVIAPGSAISETAASKLKGTPAEGQLNAIENLLAPGGAIMSIDFSGVSNEFCMLEGTTKKNMIHFSDAPEGTKEDIIYFINPESFKEAGLKTGELAIHPTELGKMEPLTWYYYDGKAVEPHHGKKLGREFLIMAIDVK